VAQLFEDERRFSDNAARQNFIFLGYPYSPPLPRDDYARVVSELQEEVPLRFWYFLDEVTTDEMMRKIWRAILRADLAVFDISGGNPNVAFELGLAVATNKRCMTFLKTGESNPLGTSDLAYSERAEYTSAITLKEKLLILAKARSSGLRLLSGLSYDLHSSAEGMPREDFEAKIMEVVRRVFSGKHINKRQAAQIMGSDGLATAVLNGLRGKDVLQVQGQRRGARWVFTDNWAYHDHEVSGVV
jgi:nucleoside 2-deoxyribosyltransferase